MTATNHAITGAAIGLISGQVVLGLGLALASHYILDMVPHFHFSGPDEVVFKTKRFHYYMAFEVAMCLTVGLALALLRPSHWLLAGGCAFVAAAPDLLVLPEFKSINAHKKWRPGLYRRLADGIEWFEKPIGLVVEIVWLGAVVWLIWPFFKG